MFDVKHGGKSNSSATSSVSINSVSGILAKSTGDSKIVRFHMRSKLAETFFDLKEPHYDKKVKNESYDYTETKKVNVSVLQVMLCGEEELLVEYLEID